MMPIAACYFCTPLVAQAVKTACNADEFSYSRFILVIFNFFFCLFVLSAFFKYTVCLWTFPGDSKVKNPPVKQETRVQSLDWEDSLEKGMAAHFSILAWEIPWTKEPGVLQSMGSQRVIHD